MAWNPSPEVAVVRDAAAKMEPLLKDKIKVAFLFYTTERDGVGYASYGRDSANCGLARRMADTAYEILAERHEDILYKHHRYEARKIGPEPDYDGIAEEVSLKIRLLQKSMQADGMTDDVRAMLVRDLVLPAVELLARFCACVNVEEDAQ